MQGTAVLGTRTLCCSTSSSFPFVLNARMNMAISAPSLHIGWAIAGNRLARRRLATVGCLVDALSSSANLLRTNTCFALPRPGCLHRIELVRACSSSPWFDGHVGPSNDGLLSRCDSACSTSPSEPARSPAGSYPSRYFLTLLLVRVYSSCFPAKWKHEQSRGLPGHPPLGGGARVQSLPLAISCQPRSLAFLEAKGSKGERGQGKWRSVRD